MLNLKKVLKERLDGAQKVVVLGVGSEMKGDDAAGLLVVERLKADYRHEQGTPRLEILFGGTAPENLTGEIKKYGPTHIIIVDAADISEKPGTIALINTEDVGGISFSTHMLPIKVMVDYLIEAIKCTVIIVGIQPKSLEYGKKPGREVTASANEVASGILHAYGRACACKAG